MKTSRKVFLATALAAVLGLGAAVGAHQAKQVREVKAANVTLYFDVSSTTWWNDAGAKTHAHCFGSDTVSDTSWPGKQMTLVSGSTTKYSVEIDSSYTKVIFTRVNPDNSSQVWNRTSKDGGTPINLPANYATNNQWNLTADGSKYDDGNYCGNWSLYTPPAVTHTIDVYVDGVKRGTETISDGELPDDGAVFGKEFVGWYDNAACSAGHEVTAVTSNAAIYGKMNPLPTVTYTIDDSRVSYSSLYLYAFESTEIKNADWPGVAISNKTITVPNDAQIIINDNDGQQTVDITQSGVANDTLQILVSETGGKNDTAWLSGGYVPATDGYYIVGTRSNWGYNGATKLDAGQGGNLAQKIQYSAIANEEFKVRSYINGTDTWYGWNGNNNYEVGSEPKELNVYINEYGNLWVEEYVAPDIPATEGYYIKGSVIGWTYDTALKMTSTSEDGNVAYYMNLSVAANEELRVCSYYTDRDPYNQWADVGNGTETFGEKSGDNFKVTVPGNYDIYAKYEQKQGDSGERFYFYVAEHVDSFTITMVGVKFAGKDSEGTIARPDQIAYSNEDFEPTPVALDGYVLRGVYTNQTCATEYEPTTFSADGTLYFKYTKLGYYLAGGADSTFSVDNATLLTGDGNNKVVGSVVVPNTASAQNPYRVKPIEYVADTGSGQPGWRSMGYTMGHEVAPAFVSIDQDSNFAFTVPGTYAFYVNSEDKVWFNGGEYAFHARFLSEVGAICNAQGGTNLATLKAKWAEMETAYKGLSEEEMEEIEEVGFDGGDEHSTDDRLRMIAKYHYIVYKYGTAEFKDFIFRQTNVAPHQSRINILFGNYIDASGTPMIIVLITSVLTITAVGGYFLLRRKKQK